MQFHADCIDWPLLAGSHTVLSLLDHGCKVTIIDNLDNAFQVAYTRMQKLAGEKSKNMTFVKVCHNHLSTRHEVLMPESCSHFDLQTALSCRET